MAYQQICPCNHVKFSHRRSYDLGNAALTIEDLLNIKQFWRKQRTSTKVLVHLRLLDKEDILFLVSLVLGELL
ncbi:MAG: hypothetical protein IJF02_01885 [Oscillospiraceae bacterium]|nr:hypothetical protein [Oscillospiraceae bacterium]